MSVRVSISFRRLLRIWIFSFTALAVGLSALLYLEHGREEVGRRLDLAEDMIQLYADDTVSIEYGRKNLVYVADALRRLNQLLKGEKTRIRDQGGKVVESTQPEEIGSLPESSSPGYAVLSAVVREHSSREVLGTLEVFLNRKTLEASAFRAAAMPALLLLFCLLLVSLLVIRSLQRRLIVPIKQLLGPDADTGETVDSSPREIQDLSTRLKRAFRERDLAMVGQLASGVIHDLRTLLHSTWSAASLASEQASGSDRRTQRLEALLKATEANFPRMQSLIESTLDGAREIRVEAAPNSIATILSQAVRVNEALARRAGVVVQLEIEEPLPKVDLDATQLERALVNLIKNGIEAANTGVSEKAVRVKAVLAGEEISIAVEDSGAGLGRQPEDVLTSLRSTKPHGTGLGLFVSKKIIEAHRGRLVAGSSRVLKGATFEVIIPVSGGRS